MVIFRSGCPSLPLMIALCQSTYFMYAYNTNKLCVDLISKLMSIIYTRLLAQWSFFMQTSAFYTYSLMLCKFPFRIQWLQKCLKWWSRWLTFKRGLDVSWMSCQTILALKNSLISLTCFWQYHHMPHCQRYGTQLFILLFKSKLFGALSLTLMPVDSVVLWNLYVKALFGLQVLVNKAQVLQECSSKFSLEGKMLILDSTFSPLSFHFTYVINLFT